MAPRLPRAGTAAINFQARSLALLTPQDIRNIKPSSLIQLTLITVSTCLLATSVEAQTLHPFAGGGDGLAATEAALWTPRGLLVGNDRSLYIAEFNGNRVRRVAPDGTITTIAGGGQLFPLQVPATDANLIQTAAIAFDSDGLAYISHTSVSEISRIDADGIGAPRFDCWVPAHPRHPRLGLQTTSLMAMRMPGSIRSTPNKR